MNVNFGNYKGPVKFENGKRYNLVVSKAEEGTSNNGKPYLRLKLETDDMRDAYEHDIYLTDKALGFAMEWFGALGLPNQGNVNIPSERIDETLRGIRLTAECYLEPYTINKGTSDEKTLYNTKWKNPERIAIGASKVEKPMPAPITESVPF